MSSAENKAVVQRFYEEILNKRNLDAADELLSPDFVRYHAAIPRPVRGPEAFKKIAALGLAALPDGHMHVEQLVAEGDWVAARFTVTGTHGGMFMGIAPTGRPVTIPGSAHFRIADGKIAEEHHIEHVLGLLQQLGATMTPPAAPTPAELGPRQ
jgi:steroid delta-isomerase-like uncharacterized protein